MTKGLDPEEISADESPEDQSQVGCPKRIGLGPDNRAVFVEANSCGFDSTNGHAPEVLQSDADQLRCEVDRFASLDGGRALGP